MKMARFLLLNGLSIVVGVLYFFVLLSGISIILSSPHEFIINNPKFHYYVALPMMLSLLYLAALFFFSKLTGAVSRNFVGFVFLAFLFGYLMFYLGGV